MAFSLNKLDSSYKDLHNEYEVLRLDFTKASGDSKQHIEATNQASLEKEIELLKTIKELKLSIQETNAENTALSEEITSLREVIAEFEENLDNISGENEEIKEALNSLTTECKEWEDKCQELFNELEGSKSQVHKLKIENDHFKSTLQQKQDEYTALSKRISAEKQKIEERSERGFQEQKNSLIERINSLEQENQSKSKHNNRFSLELRDKEFEIERLQRERDSLSGKCKALELEMKQTLSSLHDKHRREIEAVKEEYNSMVESRAREKLKSSSNPSDIGGHFRLEVQSQGEKLQSEESKSRHFKQLKHLEYKFNEKLIENTKEILVRLKEEYSPLIDDLKSKLSTVNEELVYNGDALLKLKDELLHQKALTAEAESRYSAEKKKVEILTAQASKANEYNEENENERIELLKKIKIYDHKAKNLLQNNDELKRKFDNLSSDYKVLEEGCAKLKKSKIEKEQEIALLKRDIYEKEEQISNKSSEIANVKEELELLEFANQQLEDKYTLIIESKEMTISGLTNRLSRTEEQLKEEIQKSTNLQITIKGIKASREEGIQNSEYASKELQRSKEQNVLLSEANKKNLGKIDLLRSKILAISKRLRMSMLPEIRMLRSDITSISTSLSSSTLSGRKLTLELLNRFGRIISAPDPKVAVLERNIHELQSSLLSKDHEIENLRHQLSQVQQNFDEQGLISRQRIEGVFEDKIEQLQHELEHYKSSYNESQAKLTESQNDFSRDFKLLHNKIKSHEDENKNIRKELEEARKKALGLKEKLIITESKMRTQIHSIENENLQLKSHLDILYSQRGGKKS